MNTKKMFLRGKSSGGYLIAFALLTLVTVTTQTFFSIYEDKTQTLRAEYEHGLVAVRLLEENANQTLQDAAHRIDGVVDRLTREDLSNGVTRLALDKAAQGSERDNRTLPALQFVAPSGRSWVTSLDYAAFEVDQDNRAYISYLREQLKLDAVVIASTFTRYYDGKTVLPLARNLHAADGAYLGVISTDIDVNYFKKVYDRVARENRATVALLSDTGFVVTRSPAGKMPFTASSRVDPIIQSLRKRPEEGTFMDNHFIGDGVDKPRVYAYRKLSMFPLIAFYARDLDDVLAPWRSRTIDRIIFSTAFVALHLLLSLSLLRHIRQRRVTEQRLLCSERKFSSIFQLSPVPLAMLSIDGENFVDANNAMLRKFRVSGTVFRGADFFKRDLWANREAQQKFSRALNEVSVVTRLEAVLYRNDGVPLTCEVSAREFELNGARMAILSINDITVQRAAEREILDLNDRLQRRVASRSDQLAETSDQLSATQEKMSKMQIELMRAEKKAALGALVTGVAHELNTPLGNCVTVGTTLEDDLAATKLLVASGRVKRSEIDEFIQRAESGFQLLMRNLSRTLELLSGFKQVAVDQGSNNRRQFEVDAWMKELLFTLAPMYKNTSFVLSGEAEPDLFVDSFPGAMGQIIGNLIGNSLMHGFEGRTVGSMNLTIWRHSTDQFQIIYVDDGVGITEENLSRVCDPYFTTKLGQGGSGLGMHIVYNLVTTLLGGELVIDSVPGSGVKVIITLPIEAPKGRNA